MVEAHNRFFSYFDIKFIVYKSIFGWNITFSRTFSLRVLLITYLINLIVTILLRHIRQKWYILVLDPSLNPTRVRCDNETKNNYTQSALISQITLSLKMYTAILFCHIRRQTKTFLSQPFDIGASFPFSRFLSLGTSKCFLDHFCWSSNRLRAKGASLQHTTGCRQLVLGMCGEHLFNVTITCRQV